MAEVFPGDGGAGSGVGGVAGGAGGGAGRVAEPATCDALSDDDLEVLLTDAAEIRSGAPTEASELFFEGEGPARKLDL